jgi:hypothetical protein
MRFFILTFLICSYQFAAGQIKISSQKNINFSKYKTFAVEKGQVMSLVKEKKTNENKLFEVMRESVSREMTLRGFTVTEDSLAQLTISYFYQEEDESNYSKPGPLGQTPIQNPTYVDESERSSILRTLIIEIEDNQDNSLWTATCTLDRSSKSVYALVDATVAAAFRKFKSGK